MLVLHVDGSLLLEEVQVRSLPGGKEEGPTPRAVLNAFSPFLSSSFSLLLLASSAGALARSLGRSVGDG